MTARRKTTVERSAGGVVLRSLEGCAHVLLILDPYGNWGLPKGHIEVGEGPGEAALREVSEETGLEGLCLGPELGEIDWHFRLDGRLIHKYCVFYLMGSGSGDPVPEESEGITECCWFRLETAVGKIVYENAREVVAEAHRRVVGGQGIPGEI